MLAYLHDRLQTARLRARYQRLVHERLLTLAEAAGPQPVADDPGDWTLLGSGRQLPEAARVDARSQARELTRTNPYAANILRLLEAYVTGPGLRLAHQPRQMHLADGIDDIRRAADRLWLDFLMHNQRHYSFAEHARRTWRDGE